MDSPCYVTIAATIDFQKIMNKLSIIYHINPGWLKQITDFLEDHPEFLKLLPIVAIDEFPVGLNKNPYENEKNAPTNIFETVLFGIGQADSEVAEGKEQFVLMLSHIKSVDIYNGEPIEFPPAVIPFKAMVANRLIKALNDRDMKMEDLRLDHMDDIVEHVEGVTKNTIAFVNLIHAEKDAESVIPYRDSYFIAGMEMLYGLENMTKEEIKAKTDTWKNKKVGVMFLIQYAYYPSFVGN